jgi:hypothetical protein
MDQGRSLTVAVLKRALKRALDHALNRAREQAFQGLR